MTDPEKLRLMDLIGDAAQNIVAVDFMAQHIRRHPTARVVQVCDMIDDLRGLCERQAELLGKMLDLFPEDSDRRQGIAKALKPSVN